MKFQTAHLRDIWAGGAQEAGGLLPSELKARAALKAHRDHSVCAERYKYSRRAMRKTLHQMRFCPHQPWFDQGVTRGWSRAAAQAAAPAWMKTEMWSRLASRGGETMASGDVHLVLVNGELIYVDQGGDEAGSSTCAQAAVQISRLKDDPAAQAELAAMQAVSGAAGGAGDDVFAHLGAAAAAQAVVVTVTAAFGGTLWIDNVTSRSGRPLEAASRRYVAPYVVVVVAPLSRCQIQEQVWSLPEDLSPASQSEGAHMEHERTWMHAQLYLHLKEQSCVQYARILAPHGQDQYMGWYQSVLRAGAELNEITVGSGAELMRYDHTVVLEGDGSRADLAGLNLVGQHLNARVCMVHKGRATVSTQTMKSVAYGHGEGAFDGRIHILDGADQADAQLMTHNLLLHQQARMVAIPELLCSCDAVKASHGATVSEPSAKDLWYLASRGIAQEVAYEMLVRGFIADIFQRQPQLQQQLLCQTILATLVTWLHQLPASSEVRL